MAESKEFIERLQENIDGFLNSHSRILASISLELDTISSISRDFLSGGKRFRPLFCLRGWQAAAVANTTRAVPDTIVLAASALELFHAAALVHDDLIDRSDTRRGNPSTHRRFEQVHNDSAWSGSGEHFGTSSAILLGDLLLVESDELFAEALEAEPDDANRRRARAEFNRMRLDVTAGQYLDIVAEHAWPHRNEDEQFAEAQRVLVYKSAKYSIEAPLRIGASFAGASEEQLDTISTYGVPLGIAFQLRDDVLGVFGDSSMTGKPSGDDLRDGKRTVLIALTRARLSGAERETVDAQLGDPALSKADIAHLQDLIRSSGALDEVERMITGYADDAVNVLEKAAFSTQSKDELRALAEMVTRRDS